MLRISHRLACVAVGIVLLASGASRAHPPCATSDGNNNTACGTDALENNTEAGQQNSAFGFEALLSNTDGYGNTAIGSESLFGNTTGILNTATGGALYSNTTGSNNTANGYEALNVNTTGNDNTALGVKAGENNVTGSRNTFIGYDARAKGKSYSNGIALGNEALLTASNTVVLGDTAITAIYAKVTSITAISDRRLKKDIAALPAELGLAFIVKLRPVSYRFNNGDETQRYGFVAQDLEAALPAALHDTIEKSKPEHGLALIARQNDDARTYRVAYGELTAPMVKAIQEQQQEIAELRGALKEQAAAFKAESAALHQALAAVRREVGADRLARTSATPE